MKKQQNLKKIKSILNSFPRNITVGFLCYNQDRVSFF